MTTKLLPKRARKHFMMGGLLRFFRERNADIVFGPFPLYYGLTYVFTTCTYIRELYLLSRIRASVHGLVHDEDE